MFYEVTLFMTYFAQRCVNVFNVITLDEPAVITGAFGAAQAMGFVPDEIGFPAGAFFDELRAVQNANVVYNQVRVKNPYDNTDFYSQPFASGVVGGGGGEGLSPVMSFSIFSNQTRLDIQAGQKRFVGVGEGDVATGGTLVSGAMTTLQGIADIMSAPMTYDDEGNTLSYRIVVAKKYSDLEADPPIINAYFPTEAAQMLNIATGLLWTPRPYVSSQVTRQYGRGR